MRPPPVLAPILNAICEGDRVRSGEMGNRNRPVIGTIANPVGLVKNK